MPVVQYLTAHGTDTIHTYRHQVHSETNRLLAQTETDLDNQLADITAEFGGKLRVVAKYEDEIFKPISEERLEITMGASEANGQTLRQEATLTDRMLDFERILAAEAAHLEALWKEWHATNRELVCLAIEFLGSDGVHIIPEQKDADTATSFNAAVDASEGRGNRRRDLQRQAVDLERSICTTIQETIDTFKEQEKVRWPPTSDNGNCPHD